MKNIFKGFALAVSMLTIIPFFKVHDFYKGINGYGVMFYPLVGFLLGTLLYLLYLFLNPYILSAHLGVLIFGMWILLTGALHLDGFSDTVDGLYVAKEKALQVMKDPNTGGMGMIFSVTFLILKASTLAHFQLFYLLPVILMLSRLNAVIAIYNYPYITKQGIGTLAKDEFTTKQFFITLFYSLVLVTLFKAWVLFISSFFILLFLKSFFIKRYGGFSGDIYGFSIELSELVLLNIVLIFL